MRQIRGMMRAAIQDEEVLRAAFAQKFLRDWTSVVGEMLASKSWPDRFSKGTVWVAVEGSAWATELRMRKGDILNRLNELSGQENLFKDVRFGVRALPDRETLPEEIIEERPVAVDEAPLQSLSIREIAERRLARWSKPSE